MSANPLTRMLSRWASGLRWPWLFALTATLFVIDLIVPDFIPLADEIMLALLTLLLGAWRRRREPPAEPPREPKRVN